MRRHWNSKGRFILSVIFIVFCSMLLTLCYLMYPERASPGPYLDSAHGNYNPGYGVLRTSLSTPPNDYGRGNCVHCHEQHASIGGSEPAPTGGPDKYELLAKNFNTSATAKPYAQSDDVCFYCHTTSTATLQSPAFSNYSYSITFAGNPDTTPNNIFDTFNSTSYHNLYDIWRLITGLYGSKTFTSFPADSNPCSGCHNVHIAKRSCGKPTGSYDPTKSAISRPSDHSNLWGDDTSERLNSNFTTSYQAPYWYGSTTYYEPYSTNTTTDGSNLPDYVTFCTTSHTITANSVWSTTLSGWLRPIDWSISGDKMGKKDRTGGTKEAPYTNVTKYVLACTDCHEPHGSSNLYLIRKEVNGANTAALNANTRSAWDSLCDRCHTTKLAAPYCTGDVGTLLCSGCHYHGLDF